MVPEPGTEFGKNAASISPISSGVAFVEPAFKVSLARADVLVMDGKYLAQSRREMLEAIDESPVAEEDDHALRSLAALIEAFTELEERVIRMETGPPAEGSIPHSETFGCTCLDCSAEQLASPVTAA